MAELDYWVLALDVLFGIVFLLTALHGRRLVGKEAPLWDYGGYAAAWALAIAWAFHRLEAGILVDLVLVLGIVAVGLPMVRGVRGMRRAEEGR